MDSARWERIQSLFHDALQHHTFAPRDFLEAQCDGDELLIDEVLALIESDTSSSTFVDEGVGGVAALFTEDQTAGLGARSFGPYRIRTLLGEGGMGVVYLADRPDLGSQVAIKILRDAWMSPARRQRFANEQRTLAGLNHPNIARIYDADVLPDGTPWFAMEYVEGTTLTSYCRDRNAPVRERLELFRSVCEAVQYAHSHAVIHRDLKPSNILVKNDGAVRLLDFGISRQLDAVDPPKSDILSTRTGLRLMTPAYAAPEVLRGQGVGVYTDVYSLGVLLFELLTGKLPFDPANHSPAEMDAMILGQEPEKPSIEAARAGGLSLQSLSRSAWADLDVLCMVAMHKEPGRRYASVEALIRDLDHYLTYEPLEAHADSFGYRLNKFVGRHWRPLSISALTISVVIALVIFFTVRLADARNSAVEQAARSERMQQFMLNLFDGGDKDAGPSENLRVTDIVNRGVEQARSLSSAPDIQAELYGTLGSVYENLGVLDRADELLQMSLKQHRSIEGAAVQTALSQVALGMLRADQAKLDDAETMVRAGLQTLKRSEAPGSPDIIRSTISLGKVLELRGSYNDGITLMQDSLKLQDKPGAVNPELADTIAELANHHFYAGHYELSDSLNRRVLGMYRQIHGQTHPKVAEILINLGASQLDLGHYPEAEKYDRQALAIDEKYYGPDHPETASCLTLVGRALYYQKRYDEAKPVLERALAIQERVHGPVHPAVASALNELGHIASVRHQSADAEAAFTRMIAIYRSVYHDRHYLIGIAQSNLATVYVDEKEYTRAEALYREAIQRFTDTQSAEHLNTAIARVKLGHVLLLEKRYADAEPESLAGFRILSKQGSSSMSWLTGARKDLREIYASLNQPDRERQFADTTSN